MAKKRNRPHRPRPPGPKPGSPSRGDHAPDDEQTQATRADAGSGNRTSDSDAPSRTSSTSDRRTVGRIADKRGSETQAAGKAAADGHGGAPAREPVFWFGFEVAWAKLATARIVVFGLLALDAFLQLRHAPRYGAGDFNVGQLPFLDGIGPGRIGYTVGQLIESYLFVLAALGVATRWVVPIAAAIYAWLYFGSQLDSYQHHYLMVLVLGIGCFVPWQRPAHATPSTAVRTWAIRLVLVQLAIMYLWAAISKLDPAWLGGRTLGSQLTGPLRTAIDRTVGMKVASGAVIAVELALACTVWTRGARAFASALGIVFHLGIMASGLEIGLFAHLMLGLYILVIPDAVFIWLAEQPPVLGLRRRVHAIAATASWALIGLAIVGGIALAWLVRVELALGVAIGLALVPLVLAIRAATRGMRPATTIAAAHLVALALWCAADRLSSVAVDYYNFWGGSQRRLGHFDEAERAYRSLIEVAPDRAAGHYHLGRILVRSDRGDEGLAELREAQRLEPTRARAWIEEARWLASQNRIDEAISKAKQASFAEPSSAEARAMLQSLLSNRAAPTTPDRDDDPDPP